MRILMFGWEFPPHLSGGLGTACYGMTRALAEKGVDILFVLPRLNQGDSLALPKRLRLRSASGTRVKWTATLPVDVSDTPSAAELAARTRGAVSGAEVVHEIWKKHLQVHPVDSLLTPYATSQSYAEHCESVFSGKSYMHDPLLMKHLRGASMLASPGAGEHMTRLAAQTATRLASGETELLLHGGYGSDLMSEVFRYSQSVLGLHDEAFDVIHVHDWMTYPAGMVAKHITGKPLVAHIHALESDRSGENMNHDVAAIERAGLEAADTVVAVSHYTKSRVVALYGIDPAKISVVHNAVTRNESRGKLALPEYDTEEKRVLFMGRVTFQKGPDYFVEAARLVLTRMPNVRFIMAGSGDMLSRMVRQVARLRMGNRFHFTGFLKGEEVDRMYALSDLYVMPSVSEPFGIAPLEAMSYDTPILISRQSGVSEVVRNALKVNFWDTRDMADKICAVLNYPCLATEMVKNCREELKHIRWENAANRLIHIYQCSLEQRSV